MITARCPENVFPFYWAADEVSCLKFRFVSRPRLGKEGPLGVCRIARCLSYRSVFVVSRRVSCRIAEHGALGSCPHLQHCYRCSRVAQEVNACLPPVAALLRA